MRSTRVIKGVTGPETQIFLSKFPNISGFYLDSIFHLGAASQTCNLSYFTLFFGTKIFWRFLL